MSQEKDSPPQTNWRTKRAGGDARKAIEYLKRVTGVYYANPGYTPNATEVEACSEIHSAIRRIEKALKLIEGDTSREDKQM